MSEANHQPQDIFDDNELPQEMSEDIHQSQDRSEANHQPSTKMDKFKAWGRGHLPYLRAQLTQAKSRKFSMKLPSQGSDTIELGFSSFEDSDDDDISIENPSQTTSDSISLSLESDDDGDLIRLPSDSLLHHHPLDDDEPDAPPEKPQTPPIDITPSPSPGKESSFQESNAFGYLMAQQLSQVDDQNEDLWKDILDDEAGMSGDEALHKDDDVFDIEGASQLEGLIDNSKVKDLSMAQIAQINRKMSEKEHKKMMEQLVNRNAEAEMHRKRRAKAKRKQKKLARQANQDANGEISSFFLKVQRQTLLTDESDGDESDGQESQRKVVPIKSKRARLEESDSDNEEVVIDDDNGAQQFLMDIDNMPDVTDSLNPSQKFKSPTALRSNTSRAIESEPMIQID
ncbi:hypothetical protein GEMRC1_013595 [Eukaryota sp. GEM-RC1]